MELDEGESSSKKVILAEEKSLPKTSLLVDDDPIIRKIHSTILKSLGFKVQEAENGKEAVDLFCNGAKFHIVFIDMNMPIMNGIEATKELRAMGVKSKIVGVTSRDLETEKQAFMQAGLDVCCTKPLTVAKILPILEDLTMN